jgi:cysteate synthase
MTLPHYRLLNIATSRLFDDHGWTLDDPDSPTPTLLRSQYSSSQLHVTSSSIFGFSDWLPSSSIHGTLTDAPSPITYRSTSLASHLGLTNLHITFSGYWPERSANFPTCSFKETEAYSVLGRLSNTPNIPGKSNPVLVVASAGNTARAFAHVCSLTNIPLLLVIPDSNLNALWLDHPFNRTVHVVTTPSGSDYFDAIRLSNVISKSPRFLAEGGAKNIARRDGMATTVLSAATSIGRIPDVYFQAVGSGTGAIAAWEANQRLIEDGRFGTTKMKLIVSQNVPFLPIYDAWQAKSKVLLKYDEERARLDIEKIDAKVLSNRNPPYEIRGGLYDALEDTKGRVVKVTNEELRKGCELFERLEGIDIMAEGGVATAALIDEVRAGRIEKEEVVMLNITGGGEKRFKDGGSCLDQNRNW